ncbi:MAG: alanine racemase [Planctomycetota bacterium]
MIAIRTLLAGTGSEVHGRVLTKASGDGYIRSMMTDPVLAEIRNDAIRQNLEAIRRQAKAGIPICAAIKADAYGHGFEQVLPILSESGVERLAVANLDEALRLRNLGWIGPILSFTPDLLTFDKGNRLVHAYEAVAADIFSTISTVEEARLLESAACKLNRRARVEIQIDSGIGRMGLLLENAEAVVGEILGYKHLVIEGIYTHFATADEPDLSYAREQLRRFTNLVRRFDKLGIPINMYHAANSAAVFRLPTSHLDMLRPGLSIYGYWSGPADERPDDLKPAMRVLSRLTAIRRLPAGHPIGYGCTFRTKRASIIGTVPVGYADGYRRLLSNDAVLTIPEKPGRPRKFVPVVGRVSMDQVNVDLTEAGQVDIGDEIIIIDDDPKAQNSVENLARKMETIPYELTCLLGQRIRRVLVYKARPPVKNQYSTCSSNRRVKSIPGTIS